MRTRLIRPDLRYGRVRMGDRWLCVIEIKRASGWVRIWSGSSKGARQALVGLDAYLADCQRFMDDLYAGRAGTPRLVSRL